MRTKYRNGVLVWTKMYKHKVKHGIPRGRGKKAWR